MLRVTDRAVDLAEMGFVGISVRMELRGGLFDQCFHWTVAGQTGRVRRLTNNAMGMTRRTGNALGQMPVVQKTRADG